MNLIACIKQIVKERGVEEIAKSTFLGLLCDYGAFEEESNEAAIKHILKLWLGNGKMEKISRMSSSDSLWKIDVSDIIHQTESEGFKKEVVSDLLHKLLLGIGIVDSSFNWDMDFLPNGKTKIEHTANNLRITMPKDKVGVAQSIIDYWNKNGIMSRILSISVSEQWKTEVLGVLQQTESKGYDRSVALEMIRQIVVWKGVVNSTIDWEKEFLPKEEAIKNLPENKAINKHSEYQGSMVSTTKADTFISTKKAKPRRTISFFRKFVSFFKSLTLFGWLIILTVAIIVFFVFKPRVSIDSKKKLEVVLSPQYCEREFTLKSNKKQLDLIADESWTTCQIVDNLLKIKVEENNTGNERTSILNVKAKRAKATLVLRQMPHVSYLNVEKDVVIEALGGETVITVSTDAFDLKIRNCPSWCEATVKDKKIILKCEKNTDNYAREAQVEIVADTVHAFLNISQMGVDKKTPSTSSKKKKMIIKMGHGWLEHNVDGKLLIHYKFLAKHATGKSLLVICTFHDYDKVLGNGDLKDKNGEYCLFNGLVATASNPILIEQDEQEVDGILSIPYSELHLEPSFFVFGKEFAHHLICRIKIVDVDNEDKVLDKTKLEFRYSYDTSKDIE